MRIPFRSCLTVLALALAGCWSSAQRGAPSGMGGDTSPAGSGGAAGAGGSVPVTRNVGPSGLPIPATTGVAQPAGTPGNLTVLDWAGFKSAVSWTFDDSQPSQVEHYAELNAVGVPVTFYINSSNSGALKTTWTKAVQDGHEIGNHTDHHCHADLTGCTSGAADATLDLEIDSCTTFITQSTPQTAVWTMASPFGDNGYNTPAMSRFLVNRGVGSGSVGAGTGDNTSPFNLPIYMANEGDTASVFNGYTDSARTAGRWMIFLVHTISPTTMVWYMPVAIGEVTSAMRTAGANPEIWSDTLVAIAAYWRAQKMLQAVTPTTSGGTTTWTWTLPAHFPTGKYLRVKVDGGTLTQGGAPLVWDTHGYYEIALDPGTLTLAP